MYVAVNDNDVGMSFAELGEGQAESFAGRFAEFHEWSRNGKGATGR